MRSSFVLGGLTLGLALLLTGCSKSTDFYSENPDKALEKLGECRKLGIKIQVNDTGCSNAGQGYAIAYAAKMRVIADAEREALKNWDTSKASAAK